MEETVTLVPKRNKGIRMIDLFAGTGAFTYAFQETGKVKCVFANDMVEPSKTIYDENFDHGLTLGDLNDLDVDTIPSHHLLTGGFPCFLPGTKVLTETGYKNIENVDLSDTLFTHTGTFQRIINLQRKVYTGSIHSIRIMYHPYAIQCTDEHPFYVVERKRTWNNALRRYDYAFTEPAWINAKDLTNNHFSGMPVNSEEKIPEFGIRLDKEDQWFMMGYFLGDGWVTDNHIRFAINNKDADVVVSRIRNVLPITDKKCTSGSCEKYGCSSMLWCMILKQFGKYSHGKKIPEWVQSAPVHLVNAFIDGYRTADGCIQPNSCGTPNKTISYTTVSSDIAFGLQRLYLKTGKFCTVEYTERPKTTMIEGRVVNQRDTYKMRITINNERTMLSFIENSYAWFKIRSNTVSTPEVEQTVYNFEVENDNSYCVENSICHNCQPFSIAGKQAGFEDKRSNVFWKILEILDRHTPQAVILENVKNLLSHDDGNTFQVIKDSLESRGYHLRYKVLDTAEITGVPQHRERIYIVCLKSKEVFDKFTLDFPSKPKASISSLLETNVPDKYYYTDKSSTWDLVSKAVLKKDTIYQYRRVYVRENKSNECPTLTANMGSGGHNVPLVLDDKGIRKLTPRECFSFQGFPVSYKLPGLADCNLYKLAGNAVSVPVVQLIAQRLVPLLKESLRE